MSQLSSWPSMFAAPRTAGVLLLVTATTHFSQLWILPVSHTVIASATFAIPYAAVGGALIARPTRAAAVLAITATSIGGTSGVIRFFVVQRNGFSVFHPLLDIVIIALLVSWLVAAERSR
ncbi:hypothetical protein P0W64_09280 [Tsukamurella sp. 8F]|uniref:hypothetical protein n=1 Tax=unclassified Tsukamurella TaxID=2633480 RepID=UPI0023B99D30|nr:MULTISPECIES: hypothetical protein [unclassified Tsukamurella]MDF0529772.1 hypothetical protein [Tsukamurella sp. 8J]MDF0586964.1 hypothetical protein [Tsukamurella sp. 8F]